jgi:endonuclease-3
MLIWTALQEAMTRLKKHGLTVQNVIDTNESEINELIKMVGFHNRKAGYLKASAQILRDKYQDDIPPNLAGLCALPGMGPKMSHLTMQSAWGT